MVGISIRAYARHRGVADNAVRKAIKAGRIFLDKDKTIDVTQADLDWEKNTNPSKRPASRRRPALDGAVKKDLAPNSHSFAQVRIAHEIAKTGLARQRLQEKKGQLINKDMVKAQVFRLGRQFRDVVQNWPSRVSAQMAVELQVNEHLLQITLEAYLRELLNELADAKLNIE